MMIKGNKIVRLKYFFVFSNIIDSLQTFNNRRLTFYLYYDNEIDFKDIRKIHLVMRIFVWHYIFVIISNFTYI